MPATNRMRGSGARRSGKRGTRRSAVGGSGDSGLSAARSTNWIASFRSARLIRAITPLLYHQRIVLRNVETALEEDGLEEMARVYELLKLGDTWSEISTKLGQGEDALKRRFYRFRKKFRSNN